MSKRLRFFITAVVLGLGLWLTNLFAAEQRFFLIILVSLVSYILSAWVLFEDLKGWEWVTLMILPVLFTLGAGLFANMLPTAVPRLLGLNFQIETSIFLGGVMRFIFYCFYILGMYAILLTENIFSVASIRTIQLFRAARSVSFILSLVVALFFFVVVYSLRFNFLIIMSWVGVVSFLLSFGVLWCIDLKLEHVSEVYRLSAVIAWLMAGYGAVLAFWPVRPFMGGLVLTSCFYALLGILEQRLLDKLTPLNYLEFVIFNLIIVLTTFFTTSWLG